MNDGGALDWKVLLNLSINEATIYFAARGNFSPWLFSFADLSLLIVSDVSSLSSSFLSLLSTTLVQALLSLMMLTFPLNRSTVHPYNLRFIVCIMATLHVLLLFFTQYAKLQKFLPNL